MVPAAAVEMNVKASLGASAGFSRVYGSENIAFNLKAGPFGLDAGVRFIEDFVQTNNKYYQPLYIAPQLDLFLGGFYVGCGYIVNFANPEDKEMPWIFRSGYSWDIFDFGDKGKLGFDSGLELSGIIIYYDDGTSGWTKALGNIFNLFKFTLNITYKFPI